MRSRKIMYSNTGFRNNEDKDLVDMDVPLRINSCGVYRLISRPYMFTLRPGGRQDYQLLYVAAGRGHFILENHDITVPAGGMFLYRPGQPQQYTYYLEDSPEVYWIHFTGNEAEALMLETGFTQGSVVQPGVSSQFRELFLQLIREFQVLRPCYEELMNLLFRQLLVLVRRRTAQGPGRRRRIQKEIEQAVHYFHENFSHNIEIEEYARSQHMSMCWFIRSFKQYMGVPPLKYLTSIRIAKARELLEGTDIPISEVGVLVGYDNPLYFSKIFRKCTGLSPREYRQSC